MTEPKDLRERLRQHAHDLVQVGGTNASDLRHDLLAAADALFSPSPSPEGEQDDKDSGLLGNTASDGEQHPPSCEWHLDDIGGDSMWETQCKQAFYFEGADGPKDAGFTVCPFCGGRLTELFRSFVEAQETARSTE